VKKTFLFIIHILLGAAPLYPQFVEWQWAKYSTGPGYQEGNYVVNDRTGHVYITGYFHGDSITFVNSTLLNNGYGNCFLAKYSSAGNLLWLKGAAVPNVAGLTEDIEGNIIATDTHGNVYEIGGYSGNSISLDGNVLPSTNNTPAFYLAKYDSSGNIKWIRTGSAGTLNWGEGVATDLNGNVFITGTFSGVSMQIGPTFLFNTGAQNTVDFFIAKYDSNGNLLWAKTANSNNAHASPECIASDNAGNAYLTGAFANDSVMFDDFLLKTDQPGATNIFFVKYDSAGHVVWAKSAGGAFADYGNGITADPTENVYLTGSFSSDSIAFGPYILHNQTPGGTYSDYFIAGFDSLGNTLWAKAAGGNGDDIAYTIVNHNGLIYVSGSFLSSSITFDSITLPYPPNAPDPMFMVVYDTMGNANCATDLSSGNGGNDQNGICADSDGNVYVVSTYSGINPFIVGTDSLPLTGSHNVFIAKFNCNLPTDIKQTATDKADLEIYPNPLSGYGVAKYQAPFNSKNLILKVQDIPGRNIISYSLHNTSGQINITAPLKGGVYFYSLVADGKVLTTRKVIAIE